jgi:hypothetical protein
MAEDAPWRDDTYLQPVLADDPLLFRRAYGYKDRHRKVWGLGTDMPSQT